MVPISIDIRRLVIIKFQDGWSQRKITMDLNISRHGVQRILTKFQQHKTQEDLQKSCKPQRNDDRCERLLIRDARCHPKKTTRELQIGWRSSKPTSMSTVNSILRKYGVLRRIATRKPFLN